jgi:multidrug efflux pump subunit AcrB
LWIVKLALRRPYTFVVSSMLIVLLGVLTILRMPTDIFPNIDIPVIAVCWVYTGISPEEMEQRIVSNYERALTTTVNDIEHIDSNSLSGISVVKIYFQPGAHIEAATAQVTAISQAVLKQMPPGMTPPLIIQYSASNVPILQASVSSQTLSEQTLLDLSMNFLRGGLAVVQGAQVPYPFGGKARLVMVDIDPDKLYAWGISPQDVSDAVNAQNLIIPAGTAKMGDREYAVRLNSSPSLVETFNDLPIKTVRGTTVYLRDVAHVRDGFSPQTSMVHVDGKKGVLVPILKAGGASTLDIVARVRAALPGILSTLPKEFELTLLFDQSVFVRGAVTGVVREAAIAAGLTGLLILLFLGSWRSTIIVLVSIPLSILVSIVILGWLGQTLNTMTLGGLALAVGILVDDATVEIENVHRNIGMRKTLVRAILDGAQQIAVPAFVSTICICIVFVPVVFISGAAKSLFTPLAMSVVFAMMTSYLLSRTIVPTMMNFLLVKEAAQHGQPPKTAFERFHVAFNRRFAQLQRAYGTLLAGVLAHRRLFFSAFGCFVLASLSLLLLVGRDFFPATDAGQIKLHVRAPAGTRIEETERVFADVEDTIRGDIPARDLANIIDNIGIPISSINTALGDPSMISSADGEILISLREEHRPTAEYVRKLRGDLAKRFPACGFFFLAADISTQVLNFGLSAPIDIQLAGPLQNQPKNLELAKQLRDELALIPGAVDVHLHQVPAAPELHVEVDRAMADQLGFSQRDVANNLLVTLASSTQVQPNFWLDPKKGVQYNVAVQTPQGRVDSIPAFQRTPITKGTTSQLLGNMATIDRGTSPANITHYNTMRTLDVLASVDGTDLGAVADKVQQLVEQMKPKLPRGSSFMIRGQVQSMNASFRGLSLGIVFAIVLVYLLMVVNFQSWLDPFIILMALPGALSGIAWMLYLTGTTLSVPSLMGAIMSIGVATANSILLITFANEQRELGYDARDAALMAGMTRLRPVMMTALAMIIGMLPMSLGLGEGGEQNAPLGRAVIGGLGVATIATLFFVPAVYASLRRHAVVRSRTQIELDEDDAREAAGGHRLPPPITPEVSQ